MAFSHTRMSNNRSVMPLDVRGRTRATMNKAACFILGRKVWETPVNLFVIGIEIWNPLLNEEFPVSANHQFALITSLPFVHTARRYYRLNGLVRLLDRPRCGWRQLRRRAEKTIELDHLEEVKVVTRFP